MKKMLWLLLTLFLVPAGASASTKANDLRDGGGPVPTCYPGTPQCPNGSIAGSLQFFDGGGPIPTCFPGKICK